jgi:hypothetical protein
VLAFAANPGSDGRVVLKPAVALAFAVALLAGCAPAQPLTYDNREIGLKLTYPADWKPFERKFAEAGIAEHKAELPAVDTGPAFDHIVFGVLKPMHSDNRAANPNLLVMRIEVSDADCRGIDDPRFAESDAADYAKDYKGARLVPSRHVAIPGTQGYTVEVPLIGRTFLQHRYWYCLRDHAVVLQTSSSSADGEQEVRSILGSVAVGP